MNNIDALFGLGGVQVEEPRKGPSLNHPPLWREGGLDEVLRQVYKILDSVLDNQISDMEISYED